jgi:hypothetical protein
VSEWWVQSIDSFVSTAKSLYTFPHVFINIYSVCILTFSVQIQPILSRLYEWESWYFSSTINTHCTLQMFLIVIKLCVQYQTSTHTHWLIDFKIAFYHIIT